MSAVVAVDVRPPLLTGSLVALLRERGVEPVTPVEVALGTVDLLVVSPGAPVPPVEVVLTLGSRSDGTPVASVRGSSFDPVLHLTGLDAILDFITSWTQSTGEGARL